MKRLLPLSLAILATGALADTTASYTYGGRFGEGGIRDKVTKHIFSLSNSTAFALGVNSVSLTRLQSDSVDPAEHGGGVTEWVLNEKFAWKLDDNWSVITGFEIGHENNATDADNRKVFFGPSYSLPVGPGKLSTTLLLQQEWENCDKCRKGAETEAQHHNVAYHPQLLLSTGYSVPFNLGALPAKFDVSYLIKDKKGHSAGDGTTRMEQHGRAALLVSPFKNVWVGPAYVSKHTSGQPVGGKSDQFTFNASYTF